MFKNIKIIALLVFAISFLIPQLVIAEESASPNPVTQGQTITLTGTFTGGVWSQGCFTYGGGFTGTSHHARSIYLDTVDVIDEDTGAVADTYTIDSSWYSQSDFSGVNISCPGGNDDGNRYGYQWIQSVAQISSNNLTPGKTYVIRASGREWSNATETTECDPGDPECDPEQNIYEDPAKYDEVEGTHIHQVAVIVVAGSPTATVEVTSNIPSSGNITGPESFNYNILTGGDVHPFSRPTGTYTIIPDSLNCYNSSVISSINGSSSQSGTSRSVSSGETLRFTVTYISNGSCGGEAPDPHLTFNGQASSATITQGATGTLTWTVDGDPSNCTATSTPSNGNWSGSKSDNGGSETSGAINSQVTFFIECENQYGEGYSQVIVSPQGGGEIYGCTDEDATNHDPNATVNDGSCTYPPNTPPECSGGSPQSVTTSATSGNFYVEANGVNNATSVLFPTWSDINGQDDLVWYPGTQIDSTTWRAAVNLANHRTGNPDYGSFSVHIYLNNNSHSNVWCGTANFSRIQPNQTPIGWLDQADCTLIKGWAVDMDTPNSSIGVNIYRGTTIVGSLTTDQLRSDVNSSLGISGNHGFEISTPASLKDGTTYQVYAYAVDANTGEETNLSGSPKSLNCPGPTLSVTVSANPSSGTAPLSSNITATVGGTATGTINYTFYCFLPGNTSPQYTFSSNNATEVRQCSFGAGTSTVRVDVTRQGLSASDTTTVTANSPVVPTCTLTANPTSLSWSNTGTTLTWTSSNATLLNATGNWSGSKTIPNGSEGTGHLEPGSYTYQLTATGPGGSVNCASGAGVTVNVSAPAPSTGPVVITDPNYCVSGPGGTVSWSYSDPSGSPQLKYQVQVTNTGNFGNPFFDTGQITSSANSYTIPSGTLGFNITYRARVRVWNSYNNASGWTLSNSWKTPIYAYPQVGMSWDPRSPAKGTAIQFADETIFGGGNPNNYSWDWNFGDGSTSTQQNPTHTYNSEGSFQVILTATDSAGQSCSTTGSGTIQGNDPTICNANCTINVQKPIPQIKEVAPR